MPSQPARQSVRSPCHFGIEPHPGHTAEISRRLVWRGHPARVCGQRQYHSQVDGANIILILIWRSTEPTPCGKRIAHTAQPKRASKIIPTASRNHQNRQSQPHQLTQVPVDSPIAAKEQDDVSLIRSRHSHVPVNARVGLERLKIFPRTSQPENCGGAHVRA